MQNEQTETGKEKSGQPKPATPETKKPEPLTVLKVSEYNKETGEKTQIDKPIYTREELIEYAQKGYSFDQKNEAFNALVRKEVAKTLELVKGANLGPRAEAEAVAELDDIKRDLVEFEDEDFANMDDGTAKVLKKILKKVEGVEDVVLQAQINQKETEKRKTDYNREIRKALAEYPTLVEDTFVPLVIENLFNEGVSAKAIPALAKVLSTKTVEAKTKAAETSADLEDKIRGKEEKPEPAPSPPPGGGETPTGKPGEKPPESYEELTEAVLNFTEDWKRNHT